MKIELWLEFEITQQAEKLHAAMQSGMIKSQLWEKKNFATLLKVQEQSNKAASNMVRKWGLNTFSQLQPTVE